MTNSISAFLNWSFLIAGPFILILQMLAYRKMRDAKRLRHWWIIVIAVFAAMVMAALDITGVLP